MPKFRPLALPGNPPHFRRARGTGTATDAAADEKLLSLLASRLTFVVAPDGRVFATKITPAGFRDYAVTSAAFKDLVYRLVAEHGETLDDATFAIVQKHLLSSKPAPQTSQARSLRRALRALDVVIEDARAGTVSVAGLYLLGSQLRAAIEAATEHATRPSGITS